MFTEIRSPSWRLKPSLTSKWGTFHLKSSTSRASDYLSLLVLFGLCVHYSLCSFKNFIKDINTKNMSSWLKRQERPGGRLVNTHAHTALYRLAIVVPVPAGPPLSSASSPWRCSAPAPCSVPAEPVLTSCPPRAPLSAPHVASYTPAYNTHRYLYLCFRYLAVVIQCDSLNLRQNQRMKNNVTEIRKYQWRVWKRQKVTAKEIEI